MTESSQRTADENDLEIRRVCSLLESIAQQYPKDSPESHAVQDAASAYIQVHQGNSLSLAYQRLKAATGGELSDDVMAKLRQRGIHPDELDSQHGLAAE